MIPIKVWPPEQAINMPLTILDMAEQTMISLFGPYTPILQGDISEDVVFNHNIPNQRPMKVYRSSGVNFQAPPSQQLPRYVPYGSCMNERGGDQQGLIFVGGTAHVFDVQQALEIPTSPSKGSMSSNVHIGGQLRWDTQGHQHGSLLGV